MSNVRTKITLLDMTSSQKLVAKFFQEQRSVIMAYLRKNFSKLTPEDYEDIIQESSLDLWKQINEGTLTTLTSSMSTYFCGICKMNALDMLKKKSKDLITLIDDIKEEQDTEEGLKRVEFLIHMHEEVDNTEELISKKKSALVRQIVRDLPSPCNELLWSIYRDGLSIKALVALYKYASEAVVRVTSHNCRNKFENRFSKEIESIY